MKSMLRWQPFREFGSLPKAVNQVVRDVLHPSHRRGARLLSQQSPPFELSHTWRSLLPLDICEADESLTLAMEIPGLNQKDLSNLLTISGERRNERGLKGKNYRVMERSSTAFSRSLPSYVDAERAAASYVNGASPFRSQRALKQNLKRRSESESSEPFARTRLRPRRFNVVFYVVSCTAIRGQLS